MRRAVAALALLAAAACTQHGPSTLKPFTAGAADGHFRASFPTTPKRTDQQVPSAAGPLRLVQFSSAAGDDTDYSVGWFQLAQPPAPSGANAFLEATKAGSVAAIKGRELSSAFITVEGHPAVEYVSTAAKGHYVKSRTVLVGRDVYILQVVSKAKEPPRYAQFVASFALTSA